MVERRENLPHDVESRSGGGNAIFRLQTRLMTCPFRSTIETKPLCVNLPPVGAGFCGSDLRRLVYLGGVTCPPSGGTTLGLADKFSVGIYDDV